MNIKPSNLLIFSSGIIGALCTALLVLAFQHSGQAVDNQEAQFQQLVPFRGSLELDGEQITRAGEEALWMRFDIFSSDQEVVLFSQSMRVNVINGRFSTMLGPSDDNGVGIGEAFAEADRLSVNLTLLGEHNPEDPVSTAGDDLVMQTGLPLLMSPFAAWTTRATNFNVSNSMRLGAQGLAVGDSSLGGDGTVEIAGDVQVGGDLTLRGYRLDIDPVGNRGANRRAVLPINNTILLNYAGDFGDGVHVNGGLDVVGPQAPYSTSGLHLAGSNASLRLGDGFSEGLSDPNFATVNLGSSSGSTMKLSFASPYTRLPTNYPQQLTINNGSRDLIDFEPNEVIIRRSVELKGDSEGTIIIKGDGDLEMVGSDGIALDAESMNFAGGRPLTVTGDLVATGEFLAIHATSYNVQVGPQKNPSWRDQDSRSLNMGVTEGFCFIAGLHTSSNQSDSDAVECLVEPRSGTWYLTTRSHEGAPEVSCQAHCVTWR